MQKRAISSDEVGYLLLLAALIFGSWFRIYPPMLAGFPINDGGLFLASIQALQKNDYVLPAYVQYNGLDIPFAYPPLAFYVAGVIDDVVGGDLLATVQWMPAVVLIVAIPVVYVLAALLLQSKAKAGLATLLYVLMPRSITWLIMGGGITRSLGQLFILLSAIQFYLVYTHHRRKNVLLAIIFGTLACLSHPEASIHTLTIAFIFWLWYGRNLSGTRNSFLIAVGIVVLTSPWWLTTLLRFGLAPFQSAAQTSLHNLSNLFLPFVIFSEESFLPVVAPLAILGMGVMIARRELLLPTLYIVPLYVEPRFALNVSIVPMALLGSVALCDLILPMLDSIEKQFRNVQTDLAPRNRAGPFVLGFSAICLLLGMQVTATSYSNKRVSPESRQAYTWVKTNTRRDGRFMILTGISSVLDDPDNEWFPVLAERRSITTAQGLEWLGDDRFAKALPLIRGLQQCRSELAPLACADQLARRLGLEYDYVVFTSGYNQLESHFEPSLANHPGYEVVYDSGEVLILEKTTIQEP